MTFAVEPSGAGLADNRNHRGAVHVGIGDPGNQVGRAGPERR